jgi:tetratricopeptide (TPR) repeat protein
LISANPNLYPEESSPDPRAIIVCGGGLDWELVIDDSIKTPILFDNLGRFTFPIDTKNQDAQHYFDQGMKLYYGFNHAEAFKAFRQASVLDPTSAMAWWGQALALGPNINMPMMDSVGTITAWVAIQKAVSMGTKSQREKDLIETQVVRYTKTFAGDRSALDAAYVEASRNLAEQYPNDADILALTAEAIMDVHYWDYWERDGRPKAWTPEILRNLEKSLTINPEHPGANHFYIHAVEASRNPGSAMKSADLLQTLMPGAGHMVHMPSHIYIRTGEYAKGVLSNELAAVADESYFKTSFEEGLYSLAYYPHNYHFLWACAAFEGNFAQSMKAARDVQAKTSVTMMVIPDYSFLQHLYATPIYNLIQFGRWDEVLAEPLLFPNELYLQGVWSYGKGLAFVRKGNQEAASTQLKELRTAIAGYGAATKSAWVNNPVDILRVAEKVLEAELMAAAGKQNEAKKTFEVAIKLEDGLRYNEPADWHKPVRQSYGAYLISVGDHARAEKALREDLSFYPENGWSLQGLYQVLKKQKKSKDASATLSRFNKSWTKADVILDSSSF